VRPTETIEYGLRFAASLSPWWLLVLLPAAAVAGWLLYRVQFKNVSRVHAVLLAGLRIALMVLLVFLAFRPTLLRETTLTYDGRVVFLVDDSESMGVRDNAVSDAEALHLRRRLAPELAEGAVFYQLAATLDAVEAQARRFERFARGADRGSDEFWQEASAVRDRLDEQFERFDELAKVAPRLDDEHPKRMAAIRAEARRLQAKAAPFFAGATRPGRKAFDQFCATARDLSRRLAALQGVKDSADIAGGAKALAATAEQTRQRTRIELLTRKLAQMPASLEELTGQRQFRQFVELTSGDRTGGESFDPGGLKLRFGATDLLGRISELAREKSEFPLTAVVMLSDGRDLSGRRLEPIVQTLARKQVPIYVAGVGSAAEPIDIAILGLVAPPCAALNTEVHVRLMLKTTLPREAPVRVEIRRGDKTVASAKVTVGATDRAVVTVGLTPKKLGLARYTAVVSSGPGETLPRRNNRADFVVNVRREKAKVLLLDWKPRWETRFALNIFQRLDYIDLNPIIVLAKADASLRRGVGKGAWPESLAALEMYDLVVLGDLPAGLLTPREWRDLETFVLEKAKAVCFIGPGVGAARGELPASLLPAESPGGPEAAPGQADRYQRIEDLRLTEAGRLHPITRRLAGKVRPAADVAAAGAKPDAQVLLVGAGTGAPVVTARLAGRGKSLLVDTARLWKALNPTALSAHARMYVAMLTWAIEAGYGPGEPEAAMALAVDRRSFVAEHGMQVWVRGAGEQAVTVQAFDGDTPVAEAPAKRARPGSALLRAEFDRLPAADLEFRAKDAPTITSGRVVVVQDYPELKILARDDEFAQRLAQSTGGAFCDFVDLERLFWQMKPRKTVRREQAVWRMWDAATILAVIVGLLTIEWVYRKLVGLV